MSVASDLRFFGSKSTASAVNEAGQDGLGGYISADEIKPHASQTLARLRGVTVSRVASMNGQGNGEIRLQSGPNRLAFKAPGEVSFGADVNVPIDGVYVLEAQSSGFKWIEVTVDVSDLPTPLTDTVRILADDNILFDDVTADEANAGGINYRAFFVKNTGATPLKNVQVQFDSGVPNLAVAKTAEYPASGSFKVMLSGTATLWPQSGYCRNTGTGEILYFQRKGLEFSIPAGGRRQRQTSMAAGVADDVIEYVGPVDVGLEVHVAGKITKLVNDRIAPFGVGFYHPTPTLPAPANWVIPSLGAGEFFAVWLRRVTPRLAAEVYRENVRLTVTCED